MSKKHKHKWMKQSRAVGRYTWKYCFKCERVKDFVDHGEIQTLVTDELMGT